MNEIKWHEIQEEEKEVLQTIVNPRPVNWSQVRNMYLTYIKTMDEATEIYNLENKNV